MPYSITSEVFMGWVEMILALLGLAVVFLFAVGVIVRMIRDIWKGNV